MADHEDDSHEENFDENELQEIMNEIETLEREVSSSADAPEPEPEGEQSESEEGEDEDEEKTPEQSQNTQPQEGSSKGAHLSEVPAEQTEEEGPAIDFSEEELQALEDSDHPEHESESVSSFKKPRGAEPSGHSQGHSKPVEFHAQGDMGLELSFQLGDEKAHLTVENENGKQGLRIRMAGVDVHLDADNGCRVEMEGGVYFNVPIPSESKKKAS